MYEVKKAREYMWMYAVVLLAVLVVFLLVVSLAGWCCWPTRKSSSPCRTLSALCTYADYDYVIVGSGPAGCVLAYRLSKAGYHVGLLEAGPAAPAVEDPLLHNTINLTTLILGGQEALYDWRQVTQYQQNLDRVLDWNGGRILGGGSSVNATFWLKSTQAVYDQMHWNQQDVREAQAAAEEMIGISQAPSSTVAGVKFATAIQTATGVPIVPDYNAVKVGTGVKMIATQANGIRHSAATTYLASAKRERLPLTIHAETTVTRLVQDANAFIPSSGGERTVTCRALQQGALVEFRAKKELILCAGIHSSQIMQLSGIQNLDIGEQLVDAIGLEVFFSCPAQDNVQGPGSAPYPASFYSYLPDAKGRRAYHLVGKYEATLQVMIVGLIFVLPVSRGRTGLSSRDPLQQPEVYLNVLGSEEDMTAMIYGLRQIILPIATALQAIDPNYILLLPDAATIADDALVREYILQALDVPSPVHNTCGSNSRVVSTFGQVRNTEDLRVVDVSIAPFIDGGGMECSYTIGEVIARDILKS